MLWPRWKWDDDPTQDLRLKLYALLCAVGLIYLGFFGEIWPAFWRGLTGS